MKRKISIISFILFLLFLILYYIERISFIDDFFYNGIIFFKSDLLTSFMKFITFFASTKFITIVLIILLIIYFIKKKKILLITDLIVLGEVILNSLVKVIVGRERPKLINLVTETSYSFPSGHTMVAVVFYGLIIYLISKTKLKKQTKNIIISLICILIFLIMVSRIYLGVHYFSDVMAGMFLSISYLMFAIDLLERKRIL